MIKFLENCLMQNSSPALTHLDILIRRFSLQTNQISRWGHQCFFICPPYHLWETRHAHCGLTYSTARVRDAQPFGCLCYSDLSCSVRSEHLFYFIGLQDLLICSSVQMHAGWMWTLWGLYESCRPETKQMAKNTSLLLRFFFIYMYFYL